MTIKHLVSQGFGNGVFTGSIRGLVTIGFSVDWWTAKLLTTLGYGNGVFDGGIGAIVNLGFQPRRGWGAASILGHRGPGRFFYQRIKGGH